MKVIKEQSKSLYFIFLFSIFIHSLIIFGVNFLKFNTYKLPDYENKITVDLTTERVNNENFPSFPAPVKSFEKFEKIDNYKPANLTDITPPEINSINSVNKENKVIKKNNLLKIPQNIPLSLKVKVKLLGKIANEKKKNIGKQNGNVNIKKILNNYLVSVRKKIEKNKIFPVIARKMGIEGITGIEFVMNKKGFLKKIDVVKSSGYKILDKAAMTAVERSQPFSHIPDILKLNEIKVRLSIVFKIEE